MTWLTRGYGMDVADVVNGALFEETHENMVLVRDIELYSMCEHHMLPFYGDMHIAYIPNESIVGLSKLPQIVEVFSRRLQVPERLTEQVAEALQAALAPKGVGIVVEAVHLCMMMRGAEKQSSKTITSALRGQFRVCPVTRGEFLRLAHGIGQPLPSLTTVGRLDCHLVSGDHNTLTTSAGRPWMAWLPPPRFARRSCSSGSQWTGRPPAHT